MSMVYHANQTEHARQFLGYSDAHAPVPASEIRVFLSQDDYDKRRLAWIEDKDGNFLRSYEIKECVGNRIRRTK